MNNITSRGLICIRNGLDIEFAVCRIDYYLYEDDTYKYVFVPYYDVIDLLDDNQFQGIPGIDIELRNKEYVRENVVPTFISERVPSSNRENYYELLESVNMSYMDPIQFLIKSTSAYSGDRFYLTDYRDRETIKLEEHLGKANSWGVSKIILDNMACGNKIVINGETLSNSKATFDAIKIVYEKGYKINIKKQSSGIEQAKENRKYRGRKPIHVDKLAFLEQLERVEKGEITTKEAARKLNISTDKYYRYKKQLQN